MTAGTLRSGSRDLVSALFGIRDGVNAIGLLTEGGGICEDAIHYIAEKVAADLGALIGPLAEIGGDEAEAALQAAGRTPATGEDAELLALGARFDALNDMQDRWNGGADLSEDVTSKVMADLCAVTGAIAAAPARTPAGWRVKARVAFMALQDRENINRRDGQPWRALVADDAVMLLTLEALAASAGIEA